MSKPVIFLILFVAYIVYSAFVYTKGTSSEFSFPEQKQLSINEGKKLFQENNCSSCHQLYGLGGYLGPDLTTAWSDRQRGEAYIRAMLKNGGSRMPRYDFHENEIEALTNYLRYIDSTATTYRSTQ